MSTRYVVSLGLLIAAGMALSGCERPPIDTEQTGYRGTGILEVTNPRLIPDPEAVPEALPAAPPGGPLAGEVYQNVQVLNDLNVAEFTRLMAAMTQWVSPEQGCNYCHVAEDLASDDVYTKVVSRRMLEMTRHINAAHASHVGNTGVTCLTCHRGENVPAQVWTRNPGPESVAGNFAGFRDGQNIAAPASGFASLPYDPFTRYLSASEEDAIRVISETALPTGSNPRDIKDTEWSYALMMHVSESLGVNCTYCHNSRSFIDWEQSAPARVTAWHGISMVQDINANYLGPLEAALPEQRLGVLGDAPKAHCGTCHRGMARPLGGSRLAAAYPALGVTTP